MENSKPVFFDERKTLITVFIINAALFVIEMVFGIWGNSIGLISDAFDMLADALVYFLSILVIGGTLQSKKKLTRYTGYFELVIACIGFAEIVRRLLGKEEQPHFQMMIGISLLALAANLTTVYLFTKLKSEEMHINASRIFASNDLLANLGVIIAGVIVYFTHSNKPDLIVGFIVFLIVLKGGIKIIRSSRSK